MFFCHRPFNYTCITYFHRPFAYNTYCIRSFAYTTYSLRPFSSIPFTVIGPLPIIPTTIGPLAMLVTAMHRPFSNTNCHRPFTYTSYCHRPFTDTTYSHFPPGECSRGLTSRAFYVGKTGLQVKWEHIACIQPLSNLLPSPWTPLHSPMGHSYSHSNLERNSD